MDNDFWEFVQYVEDDAAYEPIPRIFLRDMENPLERYSNVELLQRFRFSRNTIQAELLPLIYPVDNARGTNRGLPVPPIIKVCTALRFYATGSFQRVCGDLQAISQASESRIVKEVSQILSENLRRVVKFPITPEAVAENRNLFFDIARFPGVAGCIDGTHVEIKSPDGANAEVFRNRKGWMTLNVQTIAGPRCEILDIVIRWPGSAHDRRIFNNSSVKMKFEEGSVTGILLGGSAYPQTNHLYTPVSNPHTSAENAYNYSQIRTRNVVERSYGIWKGRFRCLTTASQCKLQTTTRIIASTAVLHNIAINMREDFLLDGNDFPQQVVPRDLAPVQQLRGNAIRAAFIERHFRNG